MRRREKRESGTEGGIQVEKDRDIIRVEIEIERERERKHPRIFILVI